jgi:branched-chain amino acid transport system substrate-binding protein
MTWKSLLTGILVLSLPSAFAANSELKIGVIIPLTGDAAQWGAAGKNGAMMALDALSSERRKQVSLVFEDDAMQPAKTVSAYRKLRSIDHIAAVINESSGTSKAIASLAEADRVPFLAVATDHTIARGRRYVFTIWVSPEDETRVLVPEMNRRGYRRIAAFTSIHDGMFAARDAFRSEVTPNIEVAVDVEVPIGEKDVRSYALKAARVENLDAALLMIMPGSAGLLARELRRNGFRGEFCGYEAFEDSVEVKLSEGALIGGWYAQGKAGREEWLSAYMKRFPGASTMGAANVHDAVLLLVQAFLERNSEADAADYLRTVKDFHGALGVYSATGDNRFSLPAALLKVTPNGFQPLSK